MTTKNKYLNNGLSAISAAEPQPRGLKILVLKPVFFRREKLKQRLNILKTA